MTDKPKTATASKYRVGDTLRIAQLTTENDELAKENKELKIALDAANKIIEGEMKAQSIQRIKAISDYKDAELEPLTIEELLTIEKSLARSKGLATLKSKYKTIRTGGASEEKGFTTVGNLFGKTKEQILAMGGAY